MEHFYYILSSKAGPKYTSTDNTRMYSDKMSKQKAGYFVSPSPCPLNTNSYALIISLIDACQWKWTVSCFLSSQVQKNLYRLKKIKFIISQA